VPVVRLAANSPPSRLVIPAIDLDVAVVPVGVKTSGEGAKAKSVWGDVPNAAAFHQTTAYPGNPGNTVINGHRDIFGSVFRHLDKVVVGNEIVLYVGDVAYPYSVVETLVVPETFASAKQRAENLRLIGHMPEERLTLITCTPVGLATHRLLIIAKPVEGVRPQMPEAGSEAGP
jgi:sortase A